MRDVRILQRSGRVKADQLQKIALLSALLLANRDISMTQVVIKFPETLTLWTAPEFCRSLQRIKRADEYVFDFRKTKTVEPTGMLLVSSELEQVIAANPESTFRCVNHEGMTYAGHMGFFRSFGQDFGKRPGQAAGGMNYIPITIFDTNEFIRNAAIAGREVGDEIESHSQRLTESLIGQGSGEVFETLSYSIREIMRNVVEHAQVEKFAVCSQYWPSKGRAEVAIVDRGIGLRTSLSPNPHIDASTDKSAVNYALMPAVSGKAFKGSRPMVRRGPWKNSGFGLYLTSRICRKGGNFFISSGETGMLLTSGREGKRYIDVGLTGTAVRLMIRTNQVEDLRGSLERYRAEGYEIQKRYREIVSIDPSSASLMLSQDFDLSLWDRLLLKLRSRSS